MRLFSVSMKRAPFKPFIVSIPSCRSLRNGPNARIRILSPRHSFFLPALNTATGEVLANTANRHTSAQFVEFLAQVVATQPAKTHIHIIVDNLSTHKTTAVQDFLSAHPNVQLDYTPTYSSWLNQVEIWFSKIQRDLIARGIFESRTDLHRQIMRYIRHYNKAALPFRWTYKNTDRRIR